MAVQNERRRHERILINWPVIVVTPQRYIGGEARNICLGGAYIRCNADPGKDGPLRLAIQVPTREEFIQVTCIVAWSNPHDQPDGIYFCEAGVRFTSFIGDGLQYLSEVISES